MIAKGLDFPNVTLVGVISIGTALSLPNFNSPGKIFDLLTQVSGRARRAEKTGRVMIQTYSPDNYAIKSIQSQDYGSFYRKEVRVGSQGNHPPFFYTALVTITSEDEQLAVKEVSVIKRKLMWHLHAPTIILGPTPSSVIKVKDQYYYRILIKYKHESRLHDLPHQIRDGAQLAQKQGLNIHIDNEPERIM